MNGIDVEQWDSRTDALLPAPYGKEDVLARKPENKLALQRRLGLQEDPGRLVLGLISRLTDQKGLDLVNAIFEQMLDERTQVVVLGTGDPRYESAFRYFENAHRGQVCACIMYDESLSHLGMLELGGTTMEKGHFPRKYILRRSGFLLEPADKALFLIFREGSLLVDVHHHIHGGFDRR